MTFKITILYGKKNGLAFLLWGGMAFLVWFATRALAPVLLHGRAVKFSDNQWLEWRKET